MPDRPNIWVLRTGHTGDTNNRIAIAQAITPDYEIVGISHHDWRKRLADVANAPHTVPDIFIICEQESSNPARELKHISKGKVFVVGLQTPDIDSNFFDEPRHRDCTDMQVLFKHHQSAATPAHHKYIPDPPQNRMAYDYAPTYITPASLAEAGERTVEPLRDLISCKPVYMLALGSVVDPIQAFGHSNWTDFPHEAAIMEHNLRHAVRSVAKAAAHTGGSVLVTTSRRTGKLFPALIEQELSGVPHYIYDWSKEAGAENPYQSMLAHADRIVVSADSISMIADALATGKPTFLYVPSLQPGENAGRTLKAALKETKCIRDTVKRYLYKIQEAGFVHPMRQLTSPQPKPIPPVDSAPQIGKDVLEAWKQYKEKNHSLSL